MSESFTDVHLPLVIDRASSYTPSCPPNPSNRGEARQPAGPAYSKLDIIASRRLSNSLAPPAVYDEAYASYQTLPPVQKYANQRARVGNVIMSRALQPHYEEFRRHALASLLGRSYLAKFENPQSLRTYILHSSSTASSRIIQGYKASGMQKAPMVGGVIPWNPKLGTIAASGGLLSPATILMHEIGHNVHAQIAQAHDISQFHDRLAIPHAHFSNEEERAVITGVEAATMRANGESPTRNSYLGIGSFETLGPRSVTPAKPHTQAFLERVRPGLLEQADTPVAAKAAAKGMPIDRHRTQIKAFYSERQKLENVAAKTPNSQSHRIAELLPRLTNARYGSLARAKAHLELATLDYRDALEMRHCSTATHLESALRIATRMLQANPPPTTAVADQLQELCAKARALQSATEA